MLKPGEVLQYLIAMDSTDGVARIKLETSRNNDSVWTTVRGSNGTLIDSTGTALVPLTGTLYSGQVRNETGRDTYYRWRCVTFSTASSDKINWSLINAPQASIWLNQQRGVCVIVDDEDPTDGTLGDGVGYAAGGSIYISYHESTDSIDPKIWFNNGSESSPDWDAFG